MIKRWSAFLVIVIGIVLMLIPFVVPLVSSYAITKPISSALSIIGVAALFVSFVLYVLDTEDRIKADLAAHRSELNVSIADAKAEASKEFEFIKLRLAEFATAMNEFSTTINEFSTTINEFSKSNNELLLQFKGPGKFKQIGDPQTWEFKKGKIRGWNPNWALEISAESKIKDELRAVHRMRVLNEDITEIEYFCVDNISSDSSDVFVNGKKNVFSYFGSEPFLEFVNALVNESRDQEAVKNKLDKFIVWRLDMKELERGKDELSAMVRSIIHMLFIIGERKSGIMTTLLFFNLEPYYNETIKKHSHYLEFSGSAPDTGDKSLSTHHSEQLNDVQRLLKKQGYKPSTVEHKNGKARFIPKA